MLRRAVPAALAMAALLRTAASAEATEVAHAASSLLGCLEPIARMFHVRIIDTTGRAPSIACSSTPRDRELESTLDHVLKPNGLDWRRREDGTIEIVAPAAASLKLPALDIDGDPVPDVARPDHPLATPLVERATAVTSLDRRWLDTAPLLGFNQISWYAPNVYGTGQSLAIRGTQRDTDYFPALTVTFDGIDLGTRLLDDELVPLEDVSDLSLARGPRTFESGEAAQAGAISLKTPPPAAEPTSSLALGVGNYGERNGEVAWSGPIGGSAFGATFALDEHELPSFVRQVVVPQASVDKRHNDFARMKLRYAADTGLSAELSAMALSGDSSDRAIVPPPLIPGSPPQFDPFDRDSYANNPARARTHARGAAGFVRYEASDRWSVDAHGSVTAISRDLTEVPSGTQWSETELRRRSGVTLADHIAPDWTLVAGVEQDYTAASFFSPISPAQMVLNYVATTTDSAAMWIERSWNSTWTAGLGARWSYESTTMSNYGLHGYGYHVPIPLAIVEWQPWKDQTFSLSYGTGYRSGGQINTGPATYVPERSRNFEFAWRAQWLDGKVHTALSAFEGEIHNRFTYYLTNTGGTLFASVRDRGIEFEITDDLSDAWRLRAGIGSLNSHFSSFIYQFGEPTAEAPPETATFGMRYGFERGWYGALDVYHAAAALYYSPSGRLPAYTAVSVGAGYRSKDWDTKLIVTNALDADFIERIELSAAYQTGYRLGDPRRIELRIKRNW